MADIHVQIASHVPREGLVPIRLHGGPWNGKDVYVADAQADFVRVNGPRHGQHSVWITHLYQRSEGRLEYVSTEITPLSAWPISLGEENAKG